MNHSRFQGVSPVLLSSSCDVAALNSAIPDIGQLSYPFRRAIIIEEIAFDLRVADPDTNAPNLGSFVYAKLALGNHYFMRDPVPLWLLGTFMTSTQEAALDSTLTTKTCYSHYRWRLPEPLYVEAGQILRSTFSRPTTLPGAVFGSINVQVTYKGRTVAQNQPRPKLLAVPYAAPFVTDFGNVYQQSNEKHLFNPFDIPIRVQRLTGRTLSAQDGTTGPVAYMGFTPGIPQSGTTILMNDSWGGKMVNNNTGPSDVFDILRGAWTVDTMMPPKGIYEARVWNIATNTQVQIGMIGVREEPL
jgi:hypothetical protein